MPRLLLSDSQWSYLLKIFQEIKIYETPSLRLTVEGILWKLRTGAPWRDLPEYFGKWKSVFNQFNRWSRKEKFRQIFLLIRGELDNEWNFMDGTIVRAHQHASGAAFNQERAIGSSRGGKTSKVHMLADSHGNPVDFEITEGQVHDVKIAAQLLEKCEAETLINDKGYDSEELREQARAKGMIPCIPRRRNSFKPNPGFDSDLYKIRHLIENLFARLKHFRSIATRYEKLKRNYAAIWYLGCTLLWLKL